MIADVGEHVSEPGAGIDVVQLRRDDQRIHLRRPLPTTVGSGEEGNHPFILPMSDKNWKSSTRGIRSFDTRSLFGV